MTKPVSISKKSCKQHTPEFRNEALMLAERIGVAARELSLYESQLYAWRCKINNAHGSSEREQEMSVDIARLKRQLLNGTRSWPFSKSLERSLSTLKNIGLNSALKPCVGYCGSPAAAGMHGV